MIAFITFKSSLVPLSEGLWSSNSWEFEVSGFRRNRTDDLGIDSPSLWPTEPRLHVRSDRFGKIIKLIFSKFWKREFQFLPDFQNFFGLLKFGEKYFFGIYSKFPVDLASVGVYSATSKDVDCEFLGSKPTVIIWNLYKFKTKYWVSLKFLFRFTRICTTYISFFDVKFEHSNLQGPFCELLSHTTSLYLMIFVTGSCKKWRSGILWPQ